jgi:hypothetical protein
MFDEPNEEDIYPQVYAVAAIPSASGYPAAIPQRCVAGARKYLDEDFDPV